MANSENDTSVLNWYENYKIIEENKIKFLSEDFCDNIILYTIDEIGEIFKDGKAIKVTIHNELINTFISSFLMDEGLQPMKDYKIKLKGMEGVKSSTITNDDVKIYNKYYNKNIENKKKLTKQRIKVSLCNVNLKKVFTIFKEKNEEMKNF